MSIDIEPEFNVALIARSASPAGLRLAIGTPCIPYHLNSSCLDIRQHMAEIRQTVLQCDTAYLLVWGHHNKHKNCQGTNAKRNDYRQ